MLHSIRWRLVASFLLVTLLTVSLIGVMALSLIRQQVASQEVAYLQANASAVARQATSLMEPMVNQTDLQELARTSAFLSNSHIRILDGRGNTLADSGQPASDVEYLWLPSLLELFPDLDASLFGGGPVRMAVPLDRSDRAEGLRRGGLSLDDLPPGTEYTVIRLEETPWGRGWFLRSARRRGLRPRPRWPQKSARPAARPRPPNAPCCTRSPASAAGWAMWS